jgi:hypothetical protein
MSHNEIRSISQIHSTRACFVHNLWLMINLTQMVLLDQLVLLLQGMAQAQCLGMEEECMEAD